MTDPTPDPDDTNAVLDAFEAAGATVRRSDCERCGHPYEAHVGRARWCPKNTPEHPQYDEEQR